MKPKRTILCVDEDERSLSIRKVMLETRGYRVVACSEAARAVDLMKAGGIDLVLADLMMLKLGSAQADRPAQGHLADYSGDRVLGGFAGTVPDDILADVFLSKANCSAAQLLDHIRMALVRKRDQAGGEQSPAAPASLARHSHAIMPLEHFTGVLVARSSNSLICGGTRAVTTQEHNQSCGFGSACT